ncbi:GNAT family N-acetyltransferase [uncultured Thiocystis sp.]|uniref:GNAT family N-acetyltransferase n=1 Tax=uncultured Thiocystis sp. TaxID=1202134 RepID=UPI0025ED9514|nr:GNAT family N-acetyltransferase [uncultured Thiocystis sp.]
MTSGWRIERLGTQDRTTFCSGSDELDRYFRDHVTQDIRRRLSNCFVLLDASDGFAGYYTFAATSVPVNELPADLTQRLPRYPSLPAVLIGRLAIDRRCHRQGLGSLLIADAAARAIRAEPAIYALVVDAKHDEAAAFYLHLGFQCFFSQPQRLFIALSEVAGRLSP